MQFSLTLQRFEARGRENRVSAVNEIRHVRRVELSPEKANSGTKSATPFQILCPGHITDSDFFIAFVKPLVPKRFATFSSRYRSPVENGNPLPENAKIA